MNGVNLFLVACLTLISLAFGLRCYTGFTLIRGQTVGTTSEECSSLSDYCYRANADINFLSSIKKAGCSTLRCSINQNKCIKQNIAGSDVEFCCCNDRDLCNHSMLSSGLSYIVILGTILMVVIVREL